MSCWKVIVVGGGASGLMAANVIHDEIKRWGAAPCVIDGNNKMAKKLLATGNGRCNLSHEKIAPDCYHGDPLAAEVLDKLSPEAVRKELSSRGILLWTDREGRVYPNGSQAALVADILVHGSGSWIYGSPVTKIRKERDDEYGGELFHVWTADGQLHRAEEVILACGGRSYPSLSLGTSGYELARSFGHSVTELAPSLVPLRTSKPVHFLKGARARGKITLYQKGRKIYEETGEVIFGDKHLSGICVFNASSFLRETGLDHVELALDLFPQMTHEEVCRYLMGVRENRPVWLRQELFSGSLPEKIGKALCRELELGSGLSVGGLSSEALEKAAGLAKDWRFPITGVGSWQEAQVTSGGVPLSEVNLDTMESRLCRGLYLTGELLDVDGMCGGYNLHWAWLTGILAGRAAAAVKGTF